MVTTQQVIEQLAGKQIVRELEVYLEEHFESFKEVRRRYLSAVEQLGDELRANESLSVAKLVDAIERQTASNLLFSGVLGIKANLDHFTDPMARTVLDVDFDVFLRENMARRLPAYEQAQNVIDSFFALLTPQQKEVFGDIIEYVSYLETTGPKLAHYYGHIIGNKTLYNVVPGYHSDEVLTMRYKSMLAGYWGGDLLTIEN